MPVRQLGGASFYCARPTKILATARRPRSCWRAKGDENLTSIVTEGKKALAAIIGKDTELKTIAVNAGAEDGWLLDDA